MIIYLFLLLLREEVPDRKWHGFTLGYLFASTIYEDVRLCLYFGLGYRDNLSYLRNLEDLLIFICTF